MIPPIATIIECLPKHDGDVIVRHYTEVDLAAFGR
jgi:hypothetical protein